MSTPNQDSLPGSTVLPILAMADPAAAVARKMEVEKEDVSIVSVETLNKDEIKVRFFII